MDRNIPYLLHKYGTKDANEIWATEHETKYKQNQRTKQRLYQLDCIVNERTTISRGTFKLPKQQKDRAKYLITHLDFNTSRTNEQQFIVMILTYVKLESNPRASVIHYYKLLEAYDIELTTFIKFLVNLNKHHITN